MGARAEQLAKKFDDHFTAIGKLGYFDTIDALYNHWILGKTATRRQPRWSVVRNILHWVE